MSLEVSGLAFSYDGAPLLEDVHLGLAGGELGFLLGPSGSGKTTLLRSIAGLERPEAGRVHVDGSDVTRLPAHRRKVGLVPQDQALFPHLDVGQNVAFGLRYQGVPRREQRATAKAWLEEVGMAGRIDDRVDQLSGGQRQRVALVRTLATRPRAVLLDEPLSGLDQELREDVGGRIKDLLHRQRVAGLWVTHDEGEARRWGDRLWRIHARSVVPA